MRRTSASIGILRVSVLLASALWAHSVSADTSTSYSLVSDFPNTTVQNQGTSTNFTLSEGQMSWNGKPLASTSYQITVPGGGVTGDSSSSSTSSSASSSASSTTGGRGSRGDRAGDNVSSSASSVPASSSSSSFSSSSSVRTSSSRSRSSSVAPTHGAASSMSGDASSLAGFIDAVRIPPTITPGTPMTVMWPPASFCASGDIRSVSFFGTMAPICDVQASSQDLTEMGRQFSVAYAWILLIVLLFCIGLCAHLAKRRMKNSLMKALLRMIGYASHTMAILLITLSIVSIVRAAQTAPNTHIYNGRLLDSSGTAVTTSTAIRFSYWKSRDFVASDLTATGSINTSATDYAGWQETHSVTPNSSGYFSVTLGSVTALPNFATLPPQTLLSLFLQVDVKAAAAADSAYELLDPDPTDTGIDRSGVLSVPFAKNADTIDRREIGTGSGDIAIFGPNGALPVSTMPSGTNTSTFTIDANNSEISEIALTFGEALGKKLTYDIVDSAFRFNDDVEIEGNLTVSGLINGINITQIQSSTGALKASSGGGLNLGVANGSYRLSGTIVNYASGTIAMPANATSAVFFGSGGLAHATAFPTDESFIPVAIVTTSAGSITSVQDRRALSSDDREHTTINVFNPGFEKASYQGDGGDNIGQLSVSHDNISLKNFYVWTSTKPTTLQDYDIILRVPVPAHFVRWKSDATENPISLAYRSTSLSSADNKLDIQIYDTNGVPVTLSGSVSNLAGTSWSTTNIDFTGSPTWTAGQDMLLRLRLSAKDAYQMQIGTLKLQFVELE